MIEFNVGVQFSRANASRNKKLARIILSVAGQMILWLHRNSWRPIWVRKQNNLSGIFKFSLIGSFKIYIQRNWCWWQRTITKTLNLLRATCLVCYIAMKSTSGTVKAVLISEITSPSDYSFSSSRVEENTVYPRKSHFLF